MFRHEIDELGGDLLGRQGQVALVFPVFVVDQDHHAALAKVLQRLLDALSGASEFFQLIGISGQWGHGHLAELPGSGRSNYLFFINCSKYLASTSTSRFTLSPIFLPVKVEAFWV